METKREISGGYKAAEEMEEDKDAGRKMADLQAMIEDLREQLESIGRQIRMAVESPGEDERGKEERVNRMDGG